MARHIIVTIDTEVDKGPGWRISNPPTFRSVTVGIPDVLTPLFCEFNVKPCYFVSPEVLEDRDCAQLLKFLVGNHSIEVGAHLHPEFVDPGRQLFPATMAGKSADQIQKQLPPEVEQAKLEKVTKLHEEALGDRPKTFRAGRFGISNNTLPILAKLGYRIDSSMTPGIRWGLKEGVLDYRRSPTAPYWVSTPHGKILEVPLGIRPGGDVARSLQAWPHTLARVAAKLIGPAARPLWLRPGFSSAAQLVEYVSGSTEQIMVLMFHSVEVIPGANPYFQTQQQANQVTDSLRHLFEYCSRESIQFSFLRDVEALIA
jgi:hypothetical protein